MGELIQFVCYNTKLKQKNGRGKKHSRSSSCSFLALGNLGLDYLECHIKLTAINSSTTAQTASFFLSSPELSARTASTIESASWPRCSRHLGLSLSPISLVPQIHTSKAPEAAENIQGSQPVPEPENKTRAGGADPSAGTPAVVRPRIRRLTSKMTAAPARNPGSADGRDVTVHRRSGLCVADAEDAYSG